jgi:predicted cupin superfamily sugar epimerase
MSDEATDLIRQLKLKPHPEGGWFRETFCDAKTSRGRAHSTAIYFLLKKGEASRWHRIDAAEIWHWYAGAPLELCIAQDLTKPKRHILGNRFARGEQPQIVVPAKAWQCARSLGAYTLVGCTVAPAFVFDKFELLPVSGGESTSSEKPYSARGRSRAKTPGPHNRRRD